MNFHMLWEAMQLGKEPDQPLDDQALSVIRTGMGISDTFWDEFFSVLNNAEGLSQLLDIPVEKIVTWREKIQKAIKTVHKADGEESPSKNKKLINTGQPDIGEDE